MSDIKWVKITTDMFDNEKIKLISALPEGDAILVIWIRLILLAGKINDKGSIYLNETVPYTAEMLATIFNKPLQTLKLAMNTFERMQMIKVSSDIISLVSWDIYQNVEGMEKVRFLTNERVKRCRNNKKLELEQTRNVTDNATVTQSNAPRVRIENKKENKIKNKNNTYIQDFDTLWGQYPIKDGKRAALKYFTATVKNDTDLENIKKALKNYLNMIVTKKKAQQYIKNGSTWFNNWQDCIELDKPITTQPKSVAL